MSDTEQKDKIIPSYQNTALFKGNDGLLFAFKKTQKLAAAVYLVTDLVSEEEKLRRDLRELSVGLVKDILSSATLRGVLPSVRILEILSLLEIASGARLISPMNAEVLKREYDQVLETLAKAENLSSAPAVTLSEELLKTDAMPPVPGLLSVSSVLDPSYVSASIFATPASNLPRRTPSPIGQSKGQEAAVTKERSLSILDLIKKSSLPLSIKDIASHIRGVGEKTIQRELGSLVAQGVLKREGERRWSRYSLR